MEIEVVKSLTIELEKACTEAERHGKHQLDLDFFCEISVKKHLIAFLTVLPAEIKNLFKTPRRPRPEPQTKSKITLSECIQPFFNMWKLNVGSFYTQVDDKFERYQCPLSGTYVFLDRVETRYGADRVRRRLLYVVFSFIKDLSGRTRLRGPILEKLVQIIIQSGLVDASSEDVAGKLGSWSTRGDKYRSLAGDVGGLGSLFLIPETYPDSFWEQRLPQSGPMREKTTELLKQQGIHEETTRIGANGVAESIINHVVSKVAQQLAEGEIKESTGNISSIGSNIYSAEFVTPRQLIRGDGEVNQRLMERRGVHNSSAAASNILSLHTNPTLPSALNSDFIPNDSITEPQTPSSLPLYNGETIPDTSIQRVPQQPYRSPHNPTCNLDIPSQSQLRRDASSSPSYIQQGTSPDLYSTNFLDPSSYMQMSASPSTFDPADYMGISRNETNLGLSTVPFDPTSYMGSGTSQNEAHVEASAVSFDPSNYMQMSASPSTFDPAGYMGISRNETNLGLSTVPFDPTSYMGSGTSQNEAHVEASAVPFDPSSYMQTRHNAEFPSTQRRV
ncbi:hypothetical protein AJ79_08684 [Helicocarpus griseus UAMH5409]|uniref:Uncharacterized protein n=1 Tax=Helicocarpus griseus UAMH5409 TaxID=1447875 RepID=A0A2B7WRJ9_9EURO|nr:hypothetical protein AJ79_08684 [Helicocarpus griseus UAMH5409]